LQHKRGGHFLFASANLWSSSVDINAITIPTHSVLHIQLHSNCH
jgi:hypothetical protein